MDRIGRVAELVKTFSLQSMKEPGAMRIAQQIDEIYREEMRKLRSDWFHKGQNSFKRTNRSGCCCCISEDDEIESLCGLHEEYLKAQAK